MRGERLLGPAVHYLIGSGFAALLLGVWGLGWLGRPTLVPALVVGIGTVGAPLLVMQPAMGAGIAEVIKTVGDDPTARMIGEFGIGTNKGARLSPNMLEAEKAFGTVHFAIGDSYGIGRNKSKFHFDALVEKVTITAKGKVIAKNGKWGT